MKNKKVLLIPLIFILCLSFVLATPSFKVTIQDAYDYSTGQKIAGIDANNKFLVQTKIVNEGSAGSMRVECGMYDVNTITSWYGSPTLAIFANFIGENAKNVPNCIESEKNVDTVDSFLDAGKNQIIQFELFAPESEPGLYYLHCVTYENCYKDNPDTGATSYDLSAITLFSGHDVVESCDDGIFNQDETDTDCGGGCDDCGNYYKCKVNSDCDSNNCDDSGVCLEQGQVDPPWVEPPTTPPTTPPTPPVDNGINFFSLQILGLLLIVGGIVTGAFMNPYFFAFIPLGLIVFVVGFL